METIALSTWDYAKREGREEGIEEGIQKGIQKKAIEMAFKLFVDFPDWTDKKIADFVGLPLDVIRKARVDFMKNK